MYPELYITNLQDRSRKGSMARTKAPADTQQQRSKHSDNASVFQEMVSLNTEAGGTRNSLMTALVVAE